MFKWLKHFFCRDTGKRLFLADAETFWSLVTAAKGVPVIRRGVEVLPLERVGYADFQDARLLLTGGNLSDWETIKKILTLVTSKPVDWDCVNKWKLIGALAFFVEQVKRAAELESKNIDIDTTWIAAGGQKLERYKYLSTLIFLAKEFGVLPDQIGRLEWLMVFLYLAYENDYQKISKKNYELKNKLKQ